jgi:hypothetical protein
MYMSHPHGAEFGNDVVERMLAQRFMQSPQKRPQTG